MRGSIVEQNDTTLIIDLGFGKTVIEKDEVDRIDSTEEETEWGSASPAAASSSIPLRLQSVADTMGRVLQARAGAVGWRREAERLENRVLEIQILLDSLRAELVAASRRIQEASPYGNVIAYNNLVAFNSFG